MDLIPYIARLHQDLRAAAEAGSEDSLVVVERLAAALEASTRLMLLDAVVEAAGEITRGLAPGAVDVRLRGREVEFVVTPPATVAAAASDRAAAPSPNTEDADEGGTARLSLRLPERLKPLVERAAETAGLSVNAWLVRSITTLVEGPPAVGPTPPAMTGGQRHTGWAR